MDNMQANFDMTTGRGVAVLLRRHFRGMVLLAKAAIALLFAISGAAQAQPPGGTGGPPPAMPVEVEQVHVGRWDQTASAIASLKANESVVIKPEVSGRIKSIDFQEGQPVPAGQVLFRLDAADFDAQVLQSRTQVRLAELTFNRAKDLRAKNLVSGQEYDEAEAKLQELRARVALDEAKLEKMTLKAPFGGVLGVRKVSVGAYVKEGDELVALDDLDPIKVDVRIPETFIALIGNKQRFSLQVDTYPKETFSGEVYAVDSALDPATRTILLRGRVSNERTLLRPGMFARVSVVLSTIERAMSVSERAVVPMGDKTMVYRVVEGKAQMVRVELGERQAGKVMVKSGLAANDTIVTAGQAKLRDGASVMVAGAGGPPGAGQQKP